MTGGGRNRENEQPYERLLNYGVELTEDVLDTVGCLGLWLGGWLLSAVLLNAVFGDLPGLLDWLLLAPSFLLAFWLCSRD